MREKTQTEYSAILKMEGIIVSPLIGMTEGVIPNASNSIEADIEIVFGMSSLSNKLMRKPDHFFSKIGFLKPWHSIIISAPLINSGFIFLYVSIKLPKIRLGIEEVISMFGDVHLFLAYSLYIMLSFP